MRVGTLEQRRQSKDPCEVKHGNKQPMSERRGVVTNSQKSVKTVKREVVHVCQLVSIYISK